MTIKPSNHIDFDYWLQLAQDDPIHFESLRSEVLEDCIQRSSGAQQPRLRGLQWRIDRIREKAQNPMSACISISNMMWETFSDLAEGYQHLQQLQSGQIGALSDIPTSVRPSVTTSATILPFKPHPI